MLGTTVAGRNRLSHDATLHCTRTPLWLARRSCLGFQVLGFSMSSNQSTTTQRLARFSCARLPGTFSSAECACHGHTNPEPMSGLQSLHWWVSNDPHHGHIPAETVLFFDQAYCGSHQQESQGFVATRLDDVDSGPGRVDFRRARARGIPLSWFQSPHPDAY